jgi:hypothetical protein
MNGADNVSVMDVAVSAFSGTAAFHTTTGSSTGRLDPAGTLRVTTVTIDAFVKASGHVPSLLKIDVEGAEVDVLRGAVGTLTRFRPRILLATHSEALKNTCAELLARCEYDLHELHDGRSTLADELIAYPSEIAISPRHVGLEREP